MSLPQAAADHYRQQQRLTTAVVANARRLWGQMDPVDFDREWPATRNKLTTLMSAGQTAAAAASDQYVSEVLEELGIDAPAAASVNPRAFGVSASDGRSLPSLLDGAVVTAKERGSLDAGGAWLDMAVQTQIADASRGATGTAIAARPDVTGYTRMLNTPSCSRCALLAGRFYRWSAGFARHPRCDCRHIPATENVAGDLTTDPRSYFDSLPTADQDRIFTKAGAEAIREGADMGRVVNARRGMYRSTDGRRLTRSGTSRRRGQPPRLMPEEIFKRAGSRDEAIAMLRANGYLTDATPRPLPFNQRPPVTKVANVRKATGDEYGVSAEMVKSFEPDARALRRTLQQEAARAQRDSASWFDRFDGHKLRRPPRLGTRKNAEYDWMERLSTKERQRLSRWWSDSPTSNIDVVLERAKAAGAVSDAASVDDFMDVWLHHSRQVDAGGALRRGRIPDPSRYGNLDAESLLPTLGDEGLEIGRVIGATDQQLAGYLAQRELTRHADEAWSILGPATTPVEGPIPAQMSFLSWEREVRDIEEAMRDTPGQVTEALRRRYSELVPPRMDTGQDYEELYAEIVEMSRVAELDVADWAVIPWQT